MLASFFSALSATLLVSVLLILPVCIVVCFPFLLVVFSIRLDIRPVILSLLILFRWHKGRVLFICL